MRITSVYPMKNFKLIIEIDSKEYRILDMKEFLKGEEGLLADIRDNLELFISVTIDSVSGTVCWENGLDIVDFDPFVLYEHCKEI